MPENVPIMLALCLMPARPYYAPNYAGIIRPSLASGLGTRLRYSETARIRGEYTENRSLQR